jgi:hypothetical protein
LYYFALAISPYFFSDSHKSLSKLYYFALAISPYFFSGSQVIVQVVLFRPHFLYIVVLVLVLNVREIFTAGY